MLDKPNKRRGENPPLILAFRERQLYFSAAEAVEFAAQLGLSLTHGDGGQAASRLFNKIANDYLLEIEQRFSLTSVAKQRDWADAVRGQSFRLLNLLGLYDHESGIIDTDPDEHGISAACLLLEAAQGEENPKSAFPLGQIEKTLTAGGQPMGDAVALALAWLYRAAELAAESTKPEIRKGGRKEVQGFGGLVRGLHELYRSVFERRPGLQNAPGANHRTGSFVNFMKAFVVHLHDKLPKDREHQDLRRRLKLWSDPDSNALADKWKRTCGGKNRGGKIAA